MPDLPGTPPASYDDLSALFINTTLKRSPDTSHTQLLMDRSIDIMQKAGVSVENVRAADHEIPPGVQPDMTEHGFDRDDWPAIQEKVYAADILVIGTPIWLGEKSSVCTRVIERLYGFSGELNDEGQSRYYNRVGGVIVTGNEDGVKHCAMSVLYGLGHLGYTIPPQADAGWIGEVGPGPSYGDEAEDGGSPVGFDTDFTQRNTTILTWNLIHQARMLRDRPLPSYGNDRRAWKDGSRFGYENPEYR